MSKFILGTKVGVAGIGGFLAYVLGGFDTVLKTLLALMIIDYISGILKAIYNKKLNSGIGFKGIIKKVMILLVVMLASTIQHAVISDIPIREVVIMFYVANEGISIIENLGAVIPIPDRIKLLFEQLKEKDDGRDKNN